MQDKDYSFEPCELQSCKARAIGGSRGEGEGEGQGQGDSEVEAEGKTGNAKSSAGPARCSESDQPSRLDSPLESRGLVVVLVVMARIQGLSHRSGCLQVPYSCPPGLAASTGEPSPPAPT